MRAAKKRRTKKRKNGERGDKKSEPDREKERIVARIDEGGEGEGREKKDGGKKEEKRENKRSRKAKKKKKREATEQGLVESSQEARNPLEHFIVSFSHGRYRQLRRGLPAQISSVLKVSSVFLHFLTCFSACIQRRRSKRIYRTGFVFCLCRIAFFLLESNPFLGSLLFACRQ